MARHLRQAQVQGETSTLTGRAATPQTIAVGEMGQAIKQLLDKPAGDS